ncbi:MAG: FtsX-like permease family protein [Candidatus Binatia bacterium]
MRYELFISLRYLRAKRREAFISLITLISILGVTISVMTLDVALSVTTGFENDLRERILGFTPHVVVTSYGGPVAEPEKLIGAIGHSPGVVAAAPYVYIQAMVAYGSAVTGVFIRGVDPARANVVVDVRRFLKSGSFEEMGKPHEVTMQENGAERRVALNGVIIGVELAKQLGVVEGNAVTVVLPVGTPSALGMVPKVKRFAVVGVFDSGMAEFDSALVYMALADAQALVGLGDAVTGIEIRTERLEDAYDVAARLARDVLGFPYEARDWMQMNRNVFIALRLEKLVYFLVLSLMLVVAGFSILATLIMVVMEKRKDIAILKSMGATDSSVARIFVLKGLVIGLLGTVFGNTAGLAISWLISKYKLPLPHGVFFTPTVPVQIVPEYFAAVTVAAFVVCFFVTLYPASRAARVAPVDVIRYE